MTNFKQELRNKYSNKDTMLRLELNLDDLFESSCYMNSTGLLYNEMQAEYFDHYCGEVTCLDDIRYLKQLQAEFYTDFPEFSIWNFNDPTYPDWRYYLENKNYVAKETTI